VIVSHQLGGAATRRYGRTVGAEDIPSAAYSQVGSFSAGASLPDLRHAENDGQRRHLLRASRSFHIHFQVFYSSAGTPNHLCPTNLYCNVH